MKLDITNIRIIAQFYIDQGESYYYDSFVELLRFYNIKFENNVEYIEHDSLQSVKGLMFFIDQNRLYQQHKFPPKPISDEIIQRFKDIESLANSQSHEDQVNTLSIRKIVDLEEIPKNDIFKKNIKIQYIGHTINPTSFIMDHVFEFTFDNIDDLTIYKLSN